jgi:MFS family permease
VHSSRGRWSSTSRTRRTSPLAGGLAIFAVAGTATLAVVLMRHVPARTVMVTGAGALLGGVAVVLTGLALRSAPVFFAGATIAGVGFGAGFQGAIRSVVPLAAPSERAGVLSVVFSVSYVSMGLPSVLGGVLAVHGGVTAASREYGGAVMALAAITLFGLALAPTAAQRARPAPAS